jgi:hypothetical protein
MKKLYFLVNLILFCTFAASFLTIFFFTYVKKIEEQIVLNNISYLIDETFDSYVILLSDDQKKQIKEYINTIVLKDMSAEDKEVKKHNNKLRNMAFGIIGVLFVVSIVVSFIICRYKGYNFIEILIKNIILLCGVGLVEFIFLKLFGSKYICANMNFVKGKIASMIYNPSMDSQTNLPNSITQTQMLDIFNKILNNLNTNDSQKNTETINKILDVLNQTQLTNA